MPRLEACGHHLCCGSEVTVRLSLIFDTSLGSGFFVGLAVALQVWAVSWPGHVQAPELARLEVSVAGCQPRARCLSQARRGGRSGRSRWLPGANTRAALRGLAVCKGAVKVPALHNSLIYSELLSMTNSHLFAESK